MAEDNGHETKQVSSKEDIEKNKIYAILCYLGILIIVPFVVEDAKKSPFVKFHLNQGLVLFIGGIILSFIVWIPVLGWLIGLAWFVIWLIALVGAIQGQQKKAPLVGGIELLK